MDLAKLDYTTDAEKGAEHVVFDPKTKKKSDIVVYILGSHSRAYRKAKNESLRRAATEKDIDTDELSASVYAECVTGWKNVEFDGETLEFSKENVLMLFRRLPWLIDQIGVAIENMANFTKPPKKS